MIEERETGVPRQPAPQTGVTECSETLPEPKAFLLKSRQVSVLTTTVPGAPTPCSSVSTLSTSGSPPLQSKIV